MTDMVGSLALLARAAVLGAALVVLASCGPELHEGVFGCEDDSDCPAGMYCWPDDLCRISAPEDAGLPDVPRMDDGGIARDAPADAPIPDDGPYDAGDDASTITSPHNFVFVSSVARAPGMLGGVSGADTLCQDLALAARLQRPSSYRAFLSVGLRGAGAELSSSRGWVRVDGQPFADELTELMNGEVLYPIALDENGAPVSDMVATATGPTLVLSGDTCNDFTELDGMLGAIGDPRDGTDRWTQVNGGTARCDQLLRVYCFGTGLTEAVVIPDAPAGARRAFVTDGTTPGNAGVDALDQQCADEASAASLSGTYHALAAPSRDTSALSRFEDGEPWYRLDNVRLASWADLEANALVAAPSLTSMGAHVNERAWTGAHGPADLGADQACNSWMTTNILVLGRTGFSGSTTAFFDGEARGCVLTQQRVLCLED
jgi:hypothetical protein